MVEKNYRARILIEGGRFPPFGFDIAEICANSEENISKTHCARILIEGVLGFPPAGSDIAEISLEASKCLGGNREAKSI